MTVEREGYLDVDEQLLCLHFGIEVLPLLLVEQEEYDKDMVLMRTIYQRPCYLAEDCYYRVFPGYYKVQQLVLHLRHLRYMRHHQLRCRQSKSGPRQYPCPHTKRILCSTTYIGRERTEEHYGSTSWNGR